MQRSPFPGRIAVFSVQDHFAVCRLIQCCQNIEQRCLAGTGFSHDRNILSFFYGKADIGKCLYLTGSKSGRVNFL